MTASGQFRVERGRVASLTRSRADDDPELVGARQRMREYAFISAIEDALRNAPEMTPTLRARVLALFDTPTSLRPKSRC